ncbi:hypothetical protein LINPERPRIM_LOCUS14450, partial [Linum perenne]
DHLVTGYHIIEDSLTSPALQTGTKSEFKRSGNHRNKFEILPKRLLTKVFGENFFENHCRNPNFQPFPTCKGFLGLYIDLSRPDLRRDEFWLISHDLERIR